MPELSYIIVQVLYLTFLHNRPKYVLDDFFRKISIKEKGVQLSPTLKEKSLYRKGEKEMVPVGSGWLF
jgi:hypothetical protein